GPPSPTFNTFNPAGIVIYSLAAGSDGALWGSGGAAALSRITINGQTSIVPIPGPGSGHITVGPDGNLYVAQLGNQQGYFSGFTVFNPVTGAGTYVTQSFPHLAVAGADGNFWGSGGIGLPGNLMTESTIADTTPDGQFNQFPFGNDWSEGSIGLSDYTVGPDG